MFHRKKLAGKKTLEIGCGIGSFSKILSERGFQATASDISAYIIERAKKLMKEIRKKIMSEVKAREVEEQ